MNSRRKADQSKKKSVVFIWNWHEEKLGGQNFGKMVVVPNNFFSTFGLKFLLYDYTWQAKWQRQFHELVAARHFLEFSEGNWMKMTVTSPLGEMFYLP